MARRALFASILTATALLAGAPAQAAQNFGAVSNIVNQLHYNSSLSSNGFAFTIVENGQSKVLFTGIGGLHAFNDLVGFNNWANSGASGSGGYPYTPTYTGTGSYFGNGSNGGSTYNYSPTFGAVGSYFGNGNGNGNNGGGNGNGGGSGYDYSPTYGGVGSYFGDQYPYTPTFKGAGTYFGDPGGNATPQSIVSQPVPEPATWAMMIFGFFVVGGAMRRRKKAHNFA